MSSPRLILASTSPYRQGLLAELGLACLAVAPPVDEASVTADDPVELARARALAKARSVAAGAPDALVIGSDQVVHLRSAPFGKPHSDESWLQTLRLFRGEWHTLSTAVALVGPGAEEEVFVEHSRVRLRADLEDAELLAYVRLGEARGCAGGYMVERRGAWLIEDVEGDWQNVIGLPIFPLVTRLRARGWRLGPTGPTREHP
jgi:septum formation protein